MTFLPEFRIDTWDFDIFRSIVELNEYKIPDNLSNFKVIDLGAHIGSFSWLCAQRGAKEIFYCEALKENFDIGIKWIEKTYAAKKKPIFVSFNTVIWKEDKNEKLTFLKCSNPINTGGGSVLTNEIKEESLLPTFPFDDLIKLRLNKDLSKKDKILLKIDCEGSEYPILFSSKYLEQIDYICGEYHEIFENIPEIAKVENFNSFDVYTLQSFLKKRGFKYTYFNRSKDNDGNKTNLGHFWASRTKEPFFINIKLREEYQENI